MGPKEFTQHVFRVGDIVRFLPQETFNGVCLADNYTPNMAFLGGCRAQVTAVPCRGSDRIYVKVIDKAAEYQYRIGKRTSHRGEDFIFCTAMFEPAAMDSEPVVSDFSALVREDLGKELKESMEEASAAFTKWIQATDRRKEAQLACRSAGVPEYV